MSNKADSNSLILGTRNTYRQVLAPEFLKSHFGAKRVGNYYYYFFVNQSTLYLFFVRLAKNTFFGEQNFSSLCVP